MIKAGDRNNSTHPGHNETRSMGSLTRARRAGHNLIVDITKFTTNSGITHMACFSNHPRKEIPSGRMTMAAFRINLSS